MNKTAVYLDDEEIKMWMWVCENYAFLEALRLSDIKSQQITINYNPEGKPVVVASSVVLYRRKS